jgi:catechol 2,3-dioxygenase-like lactoylglutathione lyase family enzyme
MTENPVKAIDHLLTNVRDLDEAARFYDRLGFTLTPESRIEAMGIVNRLILFPDASDGSANFIELMSVFDAARLPPAMAALLSGDEGIKSMVLSLGDVERAHAHFVALGCPFGPPFHVRREWRLSATESVWPEFDVLLPVNDVVTFNGCRYHNVNLYRLPAWTTHRNGARAFDRVYCAAADTQAAASRLAKILGTTATDGAVTHRGVTIDVRRDAVVATWPVRIAGYRVIGLDENYVAQTLNPHRDITQGNQVTAFGQTIELSSQASTRIMSRNGI